MGVSFQKKFDKGETTAKIISQLSQATFFIRRSDALKSYKNTKGTVKNAKNPVVAFTALSILRNPFKVPK